MDNETKEAKETLFHKLFSNGIGVYLMAIFISFLLNKFLSFVWSGFAPVVVVLLYIIWALTRIFSSRLEPILNLRRIELFFYQILIPVLLSILVGAICVNLTETGQVESYDNIKTWIFNSGNLRLLCIVFSIGVVICYFIAYERSIICDDTNTACRLPAESIEVYKKEIEKISRDTGRIQTVLEKQSQFAYTATCIPIRYNEDHDSFVFALIRNQSHTNSQWMFPGSHVEVSNNTLKDEFELTDISIIPGTTISDKVKKEAGLYDLQLIDPNYEEISFEETADGKEQRSYPNTCYPAKAPVFNYLFRVSKSANCYKNQNHRCHYDFTYIGEYCEIDEDAAEYDVIEIELNRNKSFNNMTHADAVAHINSKLWQQINKKIGKDHGRRRKQDIPFDQLFLDSIPEMMYNAILFYVKYKGMGEDKLSATK